MSARTTNRLCTALALVGLFAVVAPSALRKDRVPDFAQYWMAGAVVLAGEPDALYPDVDPAATRNAGFVDSSSLKPAYERIARENGLAGYNRFVYPPPVAVLFAPLALLDYRTALSVWILAMCAATFGLALVAARLARELLGPDSRLLGPIALAVAVSPLTLHAIRSGNLSPLIALALGWALLALVRSRPVASGAALAVGGVFKGSSAVLLPLVAARRAWSAFGVALVAAAAVAGLTVAVIGTEPFAVFLEEVAPTHRFSEASSASQSLAALLLRATDREVLPEAWNSAIAAVHALGFGALALLVWIRREVVRRSPAHALAAGAALLANSLAFSPLVWAHYHLFAYPTLGWLVWEARRSKVRAVLALVPLTSVLAPLCLLVRIQVPLGEPLRTHMLVGALATIALAVLRLVRDED